MNSYRFLFFKTEETPENQRSSMTNSNKLTKRMTDGTYSCATTQISSSNCSGFKTSIIVNEYDESVEIKEEIIEDQERHHSGEHNLLSEKSQFDEKSVSSGKKSASKISAVCEYDETLEIKEEIIQDQERHQGGEHNLLSVKSELDEKFIPSDNNSALKTSTVYEYDETLEIKEKIIQDRERHQGKEHNLLSEKSELDEKCISSENKSALKTSTVYEYYEILEIKEEITQDQETVTDRTLNRKYESTLCNVDTREADILSADRLRTHKKKKIQESKPELEEEYKCRKCARGYKLKSSLINHQKFECSFTPQFICKFCDERFKKKNHMNRHVSVVHQKINSNQKNKKMQGTKQIPKIKQNIYSQIDKTRHNCDKCPRIYSSLSALNLHKRAKHAAIKREFTCDVCGYRTNMKGNLSQHISSHHFKNSSQVRHKCYKCAQSYSTLSGLHYHNLLKHTAVKPEFLCDFCGYKSYLKSNLSRHISSLHLKIAKTLQARHNCDKCFISYSSLSALKRHSRIKHAAFKRQFICVYCNYKTYAKYRVLSHISSLHLKTSKTMQVKHNCDKCFLSYTSLSALNRHERLKHAAVKPQ